MNSRIYTPEIGGRDAGHDGSFGSNFYARLKVTVIYTTPEGTLSSLKTAVNLARELKVTIGLVATQIVPYCLPLEANIATYFLRQRQSALVGESGIDPDEVAIQICACRDEKRGLAEFLPAHSLVIIGGIRRWWRAERRFEKWLTRMGHQVIFAEIEKRPKLLPYRIALNPK
jgi:hypothetical protein